jgi:DNA invertase Pin-like site-specific DNA recombinase
MNEFESLKKENERLRKELESLKEEKERLKRGMEAKAREGHIVSRAPFGYKVMGGSLVKTENSSVVESIFLDFQREEVSLNNLAKKYGFSVNGIKKILRNFTYLGKIKFDGEVHSGNHEPLVSSTLFNHVQDKLERKGIKNN